MPSDAVDAFEAQRPRLFALAYRLLGSASEAEDAVQEAFIRWHQADRSSVRTPAAWLTTVVTRLCLDELGSARSRRESYVGPWLPEPVLTSTPDRALGPLETVEQRDSVSIALLAMLERLTPSERAVYVLKEAFGYSHRDIAEILDVSEANCQQLHHRAAKHLADRPRFAADPDHWRRITETFFAATQDGEGLGGLERLLSDDVVAWADSGGTVTAARRPIQGNAKVARYLGRGILHLSPENLARLGRRATIHAAQINARPGLVVFLDGALFACLVIDMDDGLISALHILANPAKLGFAAAQLRDIDLGRPLASLTIE
ncbi:RNA polymerase sigma factor SigJ [Stackebrandtia sp.]|uniref:RNA polymerase sigma factor SigJ n=1 Tax=Stackebrandtia sp. TaxID=2023065 RepID=UPI0039C9DA2E